MAERLPDNGAMRPILSVLLLADDDVLSPLELLLDDSFLSLPQADTTSAPATKRAANRSDLLAPSMRASPFCGPSEGCRPVCKPKHKPPSGPVLGNEVARERRRSRGGA